MPNRDTIDNNLLSYKMNEMANFQTSFLKKSRFQAIEMAESHK